MKATLPTCLTINHLGNILFFNNHYIGTLQCNGKEEVWQDYHAHTINKPKLVILCHFQLGHAITRDLHHHLQSPKLFVVNFLSSRRLEKNPAIPLRVCDGYSWKHRTRKVITYLSGGGWFDKSAHSVSADCAFSPQLRKYFQLENTIFSFYFLFSFFLLVVLLYEIKKEP